MDAITLGPIAIPLGRLVVLLAMAAALLALRAVPAAERGSVEHALWWSAGAGLVAARVGYVLAHLHAYRLDPLSALAVWEDGFVWSIGAIVAIVVAAERAQRRSFPLRRIVVPMAAAMLTWGLGSAAAESARPTSDLRLPADARLQDLAGRTVSPDQLRGRPAIVNLWATWCPPCRREMPVLAAAQRMHPDLVFVFVNQGESPARINAYLSSAGLEIQNVWLDHAQAFAGLASAGLPTTLFFDGEGHLQARHMGALSSARLGDYLDALRATPSAGTRSFRADDRTGNPASRSMLPATLGVSSAPVGRRGAFPLVGDQRATGSPHSTFTCA